MTLKEYKKGKAASFTAWGIKDTTCLIPYIIRYADLCDVYCHPIETIFHTKKDAQDWIRTHKCGYSWHPVKLWIQEAQPRTFD